MKLRWRAARETCPSPAEQCVCVCVCVWGVNVGVRGGCQGVRVSNSGVRVNAGRESRDQG